MKLLVKALGLALMTLPLLASAGTKSASMQVSFTVTDACTVQAGATAAKAPTVACQLNAPHLMTQTPPAPVTSAEAAAVRPAASAQDWTVYF
ncbi:UNVERIFIED_ORG: hypothetical protein JN05_03840 [Zoogloea ramigera]|uniref:Uncharacterized protein n=1 Tax=Duganella zoogloeoides TaxID=75659 RepID=A0ABZ0XX20_9BURK|nr:hypothetical protein [Duganella zoogloeoides]WQH03993.1 hypothetical protein SR858_23550 [Duganella zoogloeoides]